jgi:hypothetical protein
MNISKPFKILIGLGTLWFAVYPFLFFGVMLLSMGLGPVFARNGNSPDHSFAIFGLIFPLHFCTIFIAMGLMVFYLVHVIKNTRADETIRILLGVGNYFMPFIAMPIYYYLYIWLENPPEWASAKPKQVEKPAERAN